MKSTTFSDHQGRVLFFEVIRPGRMHDQTCVRSEGIAEQFRQHPTVKAGFVHESRQRLFSTSGGTRFGSKSMFTRTDSGGSLRRIGRAR
jgi:hypothetical protein